jgi:hypothetical protein
LDFNEISVGFQCDSTWFQPRKYAFFGLTQQTWCTSKNKLDVAIKNEDLANQNWSLTAADIRLTDFMGNTSELCNVGVSEVSGSQQAMAKIRNPSLKEKISRFFRCGTERSARSGFDELEKTVSMRI